MSKDRLTDAEIAAAVESCRVVEGHATWETCDAAYTANQFRNARAVLQMSADNAGLERRAASWQAEAEANEAEIAELRRALAPLAAVWGELNTRVALDEASLWTNSGTGTRLTYRHAEAAAKLLEVQP